MKKKPEKKPLPTEVWVLRNENGTLVPPRDDDGTDTFMAWPTEAEAIIGQTHQVEMYDLGATEIVRLL